MKKITNKILIITLIISLLINIIMVVVFAKRIFVPEEPITIQAVDTVSTNVIMLEDTIVVE